MNERPALRAGNEIWREFAWRRMQMRSTTLRPLPPRNAISRHPGNFMAATIIDFTCDQYQFSSRIPAFLRLIARRALKKAGREEVKVVVRSRAGGKVIKLLLNFAITRFMSKGSERCTFERDDARDTGRFTKKFRRTSNKGGCYLCFATARAIVRHAQIILAT